MVQGEPSLEGSRSMLLFGLNGRCRLGSRLCLAPPLRSWTALSARRENQVGKKAGRWYLPKLHYWLAFSLEDSVRQEAVR